MRFKRQVQPEDNDNEGSFVSKRVQTGTKKKSVRSSTEVSNLVNKTVAAGGKLSWRPNQSINNLEQQKKQEVDKEIKEKTKLIRRRRNLRVTLRLAVFFFSMLVLYFSLCYFSKRANLSVEGLDGNSAYVKDLEKDVSKATSGGLLGSVKPSFSRYKDIETNLRKNREDVSSVELKFSLFKLRTDVKVHVNKPIIKWISAEGKTSYVDQKGRVYEPPEDLVKLFNPLEIGGAGLGTESGSKIPVSPEKLAWIVKLVPKLREGGVEATKVNIVADSLKGVEVLLAGQETRLLFSTDEEPIRSGVAAAKAVKYLQQSRAGGLVGLAYIDVRVPERVLYK